MDEGVGQNRDWLETAGSVVMQAESHKLARWITEREGEKSGLLWKLHFSCYGLQFLVNEFFTFENIFFSAEVGRIKQVIAEWCRVVLRATCSGKWNTHSLWKWLFPDGFDGGLLIQSLANCSLGFVG